MVQVVDGEQHIRHDGRMEWIIWAQREEASMVYWSNENSRRQSRAAVV